MKSKTFYYDADGNAVWGDQWIPPDNMNRDWRKLQAAIAAGKVSKVAAPESAQPDSDALPTLEEQLDEIWGLANPPADSKAYAMRQKVRNRPGRN